MEVEFISSQMHLRENPIYINAKLFSHKKNQH